MAGEASIGRGGSNVDKARGVRPTMLRVGLVALAIVLGLIGGLRNIQSEAQNPPASAPIPAPAKHPSLIDLQIQQVRSELSVNRSAQLQPGTPPDRREQLRQRERRLVELEASLAAQRNAMQISHPSQ